MNNGETNTNQTNGLAPMAGVKIAPAQEGPVNASNAATAASANSAIQQQNTVTQQPVPIQPEPVVNTTPPTVAVPTTAPEVPTTAPQAEPQIVATTPPTTPTTPTQEPVAGKKKSILTPILILIIMGLIFYNVYTTKNYNTNMQNLKTSCSPITATKEGVELDLNSFLVQDLYSKVHTNMREDIAQPEFNDEMKLYLAYRQILEKDKYDSNCNLFSATTMEPFTCEVSSSFVPKAFKVETMELAIKKLFGQNMYLPLKNIQLGNSCVVGYQYIENRGEFVEGYCNKQVATSFKVTKTLKKAVSTRSNIVLTEEVKYHENEKLSLPESLKSGTYYYTFHLDMNYNYVLVSKTYESKY